MKTLFAALVSAVCISSASAAVPFGMAEGVNLSCPNGVGLPTQVMTLDRSLAQSLQSSGCVRRSDAFLVFTVPASGTVPACQFKNVSAPVESYFYSVDPEECDSLRSDPSWVWMSDEAFFVVPLADDGGCGAGMSPVVRHYNDGSGGKPNHFYLSSFYKVKVRFGTEEGPVWCAPSVRFLK